MTEMRKDRRAPASLKVKYKSATVDDFIEQFGTDVSRGGIFIKTKKPLEAGALLKFEFQLQDGSAVLHGVGRVAWRRVEQQARPDLPAGMGIKFFKLSDHSRVVVERIESRFAGNKSRYELTDAAEFAAPMSGPPSAADSGASPLPGNGRRAGAGSAPHTVPPPPALSSIPPALADVPPSRAIGPIRQTIRGSSGGVQPKGTIGSFFPETSTRKSSGSPVRTSGSPSPASRARDTSEFLASAFQAGAGPEVRAQARAQAERARRDPESVELARELFGDVGDGAAAAPAAASVPARGQLSGAAAANAHDTPTHRPPASDAAADTFGLSTPVPAVELPRSPLPRSSQPSLADRIPSIEQLVDEAGRADPGSPSRKPLGASSASRPSGAASFASKPSAEIRSSFDPPPMGAGQSSPLMAAPAGEHEPLKLAMSVATVRPSAPAAEDPPGRSRALLFFALVSTLVLGGVAAYIGVQRNAAAERARNAEARLDTPAAAASPSDSPPSAADPSDPKSGADPAAQPTAADPAAQAPVAGPDVPLAIHAKPRNAEVWFGDKQQGTAPLTAKLPSNVPVEVSVRSPGFATVTRSITPQEGAAVEAFELAPLPYQLVVTSEPAGATIASAGKSAVSPAPLELGHLEGAVSISVDKEGFQRSTRSVKLEEFQEKDGVMRLEITLSLTPLPAKRRAPVRAIAPPPAAPVPSDAPPAPEPATAPPVMQVKPEGEPNPAQAAPSPEAKLKPAELPKAATPEPSPSPAAPEPAPN
jgi:uncharacterized protein (TIGR02266 family)